MILIYAFISVLTFFLLFKSRAISRKWKRPPGPKGLPLVGCALEINEHNILDKLFKYAEEYGDIFGIKLLHQNMICLNSEGIIRKALATEPYRQYMNDRGKFFYGETMLYGSQSVAFYGDAHSSVHSGMRKGITKGLHVYGQEGFNEFERKIQKELDRLSQKIDAFGDSDFDVVSLIQRSLTNVVSLMSSIQNDVWTINDGLGMIQRALRGKLSGEVLTDDDKDVNMFWDYVDGVNYFTSPAVNNLLSMFPILRYAPGYRSKYKYMNEAKDKITQRYFHNRKNKTQGEPMGLVDHLIDTQRKSHEEGQDVIFTDERIMSNILETVAAGILTTWSVLSSTFLCLVNNQEYQDKVFKEVAENIDRDRPPTHSDKIKCPYVEALELEVHRYMTVLPILGGRICTRDIKFEGYDIAKGTMLMVNIWYMHHNPKIWGDPWNFRPERFLDADGHVLPRDHIFRKNWIPFAIGRRQCLGEQFARSRYFLYMVTLLRQWKFIGSPGKFGECDPRNLDNIESDVTIIRPKPFFCTAQRRR